MKKTSCVVAAVLVASITSVSLPITAHAAKESLYDLFLELGSRSADDAALVADATGLAKTLDDCSDGAPTYTLFLTAENNAPGRLLDIFIENSGKTLGEVLGRPAIVKAFLANHLASGVIAESKMVDPAVTSIAMISGEPLTKTAVRSFDGSTFVTVGGRMIVDGLRSIGQANGYRACNGVVYLTDGIFNPKGTGRLTLTRSGPTLFDRLVENSLDGEVRLDTLFDAAGLSDSLRDCRQGGAEITLFLPGPGPIVDLVFGGVLTTLKETLGSLLARPDLVRELLENHIVDAYIPPEALLDTDEEGFTARSGLDLQREVVVRADGSRVVYINGHEVVAGFATSRLGRTYDTCSGALYFIDGFLSPERALAAVRFSWREAGKKWGDNRYRFGLCEDHLPWRPSCVILP